MTDKVMNSLRVSYLPFAHQLSRENFGMRRQDELVGFELLIITHDNDIGEVVPVVVAITFLVLAWSVERAWMRTLSDKTETVQGLGLPFPSSVVVVQEKQSVIRRGKPVTRRGKPVTRRGKPAMESKVFSA
jgi:hypothetical protein